MYRPYGEASKLRRLTGDRPTMARAARFLTVLALLGTLLHFADAGFNAASRHSATMRSHAKLHKRHLEESRRVLRDLGKAGKLAAAAVHGRLSQAHVESHFPNAAKGSSYPGVDALHLHSGHMDEARRILREAYAGDPRGPLGSTARLVRRAHTGGAGGAGATRQTKEEL